MIRTKKMLIITRQKKIKTDIEEAHTAQNTETGEHTHPKR